MLQDPRRLDNMASGSDIFSKTHIAKTPIACRSPKNINIEALSRLSLLT